MADEPRNCSHCVQGDKPIRDGNELVHECEWNGAPYYAACGSMPDNTPTPANKPGYCGDCGSTHVPEPPCESKKARLKRPTPAPPKGRYPTNKAQFQALSEKLQAAESELTRSRAALPSTFYADRDTAWRISKLATDWRLAIVVNQTLEAERETARAALLEMERQLKEQGETMQEMLEEEIGAHNRQKQATAEMERQRDELLLKAVSERDQIWRSLVVDAIGNWGGPESKAFEHAIAAIFAAREKWGKGLDLWGGPLSDEGELAQVCLQLRIEGELHMTTKEAAARERNGRLSAEARAEAAEQSLAQQRERGQILESALRDVRDAAQNCSRCELGHGLKERIGRLLSPES